MALDDIRRRLEALSRHPLDGRLLAGADLRPPEPVSDGHHTLAALVPGTELVLPEGRCYSVRLALSKCLSTSADLIESLADGFRNVGRRPGGCDADMAALVEAGLGRVLLMDTETCGFPGTPLFLIGTLWFADSDLHVEQLLARNYDEESAILARFASRLARRPYLVTFNGKSFDWPFITDRAAASRIAAPRYEGHVDLLHVARRRHRGSLPDCRLSTLEVFLCHRHRTGDLPSGEVPAAYHRFVATGDARPVRDILHHNFLDLVTMAQLVTHWLADPPPDGQD